MPTRASNGLGSAAKAVSERVSSIVRLEIQLAVSELKSKVASLGLGIGLLVGAGLFGLFMLMFALAAAGAAWALVVPVWAAMLIMMGILGLVAGILAFIGVGAVSKGTPPVPEQAIEEARLTTEALKNGR